MLECPGSGGGGHEGAGQAEEASGPRNPGVTAPLIALAQIVRSHGRRGEVKALLLTDQPAQLTSLAQCYLWDRRNDARRQYRIEQCRLRGNAVILALEGVGSIEQAETLVGQLLSIPEEALSPLPQGRFYASQLRGLRVVTDEGLDVGELVGLEEAPGHDLWVVRDGAREHLIPAVAEIVRRVDLSARRITIRPPEGLLDL